MDSYERVMAALNLYERSKDKTDDLRDAIMHEIAQGDGAMFDHLPDNELDTPLTKAVLLGLHDAVKAMLEKGANPNHVDGWGYTPLIITVGISSAPIEIMKALLDGGADPNAAGRFVHTPIHHAVVKRPVSFVKMLMEAKANPNLSVNGVYPSAMDELNGLIVHDQDRFRAILALMEKN